ncbi:uncharacterized protein BX663DRAFT_534764 [Cokeromyces recurvatus]|uniref:uncharacterized protein n=1 Tax=Cokeromyces recurvatus TaxID=90255 RepID=UPI00222034A3|nr:uncharacterized protein BX663DRAFT_534764 [Cokeromyces recurvatus]KAI7906673.1 hypothetical protein BX663DRAFT_534764 [Cokeromyces recurvatus]
MGQLVSSVVEMMNNYEIKIKRARSSVLKISSLLSNDANNITPTTINNQTIKAKRKRASPNQLLVLNQIFSQTYFPSTEVRAQLGKQLGMSPRTVQIWFQNKRQSLRFRGKQTMNDHSSFYLPPISPPTSPLQHRHSFNSDNNNYSLPPLTRFSVSIFPHTPSSPTFPNSPYSSI